MYIRSQDKTRIVNTTRVTTIEAVQNYVLFDDKNMGTYSSHEKAMKVLDSIFENCKNCAFVDMPWMQMPKDEEV